LKRHPMHQATRLQLLIPLLFLTVVAGIRPAASGQETNAIPATNAKPATVAMSDADQTVRAYLRLQEQLHAALLAVEQSRLEASLEARTNADRMASRLNALEELLDEQRARQEFATRSSSRTLVVLAAIVLGLGFVALVLTAFLQTRGMNRLAEIALGSPPARASGLAQLDSLPAAGAPQLLSSHATTPDGDRLLATIGRLENRIHELEHSAPFALGPGLVGSDSETPGSAAAANNPGAGTAPDQMMGLLGKGQALLHLGQAGKALQCFDEALALAPDHADAHVKRGLALERLGKLDEALKCYDRCLDLNRRHTHAALRKAEILTRQERFTEALECYEQALRPDPAR